MYNIGDTVIYQETIWKVYDVIDSLDRIFLEHVKDCLRKTSALGINLIKIT